MRRSQPDETRDRRPGTGNRCRPANADRRRALLLGFAPSRVSAPLFRFCALLPVLLLVSGCAYFNTFYNARTSYREAVQLSEQRQVGQARARFEKAIEKSALVLSRWPNSRWADDATFIIGQSYYEMEQYGRAIRHFDQLVLAFPDSPLVPRARYYRGLAMLRNREYGPARVLLEQVRRDYPHLSDGAAYHLAASFYDREDWDRAADSLAAFVEKHPRSGHRADAERRLAHSESRLGRWADAEQSYRRLAGLVSHPRERVEFRLRIGEALIARERHDEAIPIIRELIGRYPELDDEAHVLLGRALAETDRIEEAIRTWRRVRGSTELGAEAMFRIGRFHEEAHEFELARAHYDSAQARRATAEHGMLAAKRLALLDAIAHTDSAGARDPAEAQFLIAEVHNLNLAEYDTARRIYQELADSYPDTDWAPKALLARAWITRYIEDDSIGAVPELEQLIARYPGTEYAYEASRWLGLPAPPRKKPEEIAVAPPAPPEPAPDPQSDRPELPDRPTPAPPGHELPADIPDEFLEPEPEPDEYPPDRYPARPGRRAPTDMPVPPRAEPAAPESSVAVPMQAEDVPGAHPATAEDTIFAPVHFGFDEAVITTRTADMLRQAAAWLKRNPGRRLHLVGHCDPRGTDTYNLELGRLRARAVADFLGRAGIESDRLELESRGSESPVSSGPAEYWRDRRVEFRLL